MIRGTRSVPFPTIDKTRIVARTFTGSALKSPVLQYPRLRREAVQPTPSLPLLDLYADDCRVSVVELAAVHVFHCNLCAGVRESLAPTKAVCIYYQVCVGGTLALYTFFSMARTNLH
ncbi:MAG: hypothetical protein SGPRY_006170 [Prymnesium sp.]